MDEKWNEKVLIYQEGRQMNDYSIVENYILQNTERETCIFPSRQLTIYIKFLKPSLYVRIPLT